ncbi:MAG: LVIVD repeat-containing protein [Cyclobacteriaceae bacterium]
MKKNIYKIPVLIFSFVLAAMLQSCDDKVEITRTYTIFEPVYMSTTEIRSSFEVRTPEVLENPGKIYLFGDYLFINEPSKGIHIVNNADPSNPTIIKFINLPGNYDMAVRGNSLYADSYMDLVVMDISNLDDIKITHRSEDIFTNILSTQVYNPELGVIVDWEEVEKIEVSSDDFNGDFPRFYAMSDNRMAAAEVSFLSFAPQQPMVGIGGSMARFTITDNFLYAIDQSRLYSFNITNPELPAQAPTVNVGWGIETVFPYKDMLFIGAQNGMYIYSLADPLAPIQLSMYQHVMSCDPVVVNNDIAYVTLRSGNDCRGGTVNQLDVIDVHNPSSPKRLSTHQMLNPHGLGYDDGVLFICEGKHGLKVFNAIDHKKIGENILMHITGLDAYDVIPYQKNLILIGENGLRQYNYDDPSKLKLLSTLNINRPIK